MARKQIPFEQRYTETGLSPGACWLWTGGKSSNGYGEWYDVPSMSVIGAHRAQWIRTRGPIPEGLYVCHRCDVKACVNIDHLFLGTHQDNMDDRGMKGRTWNVGGMARWNCKLTDSEIHSIRAMVSCGQSQQSVADSFGINQSHVSRIVNCQDKRRRTLRR